MKPQEVNILVVGAGGIGCELLKNLILCKFTKFTVIDLDTIDLSNLNRQFLFRSKHIKQSKALVAVEAVKQFAPLETRDSLQIEAIQANIITDQQFSVDFYQKFNFVINALDNLEARSHVNKMCVITGIPLIESGTAGLLGQSSLHIPHVTQCFDCVPKTPSTKSFAVCTIRSTPSLPIHCIVWAKSWLFPMLFGDGINQEDSQGTSDEDQEELSKLKAESQELSSLRQLMSECQDLNDYAQKVFDKIYFQDVSRVAQIDEMWNKPGRKRPVPLKQEGLFGLYMQNKENSQEAGSQDDHKVWDIQSNYNKFMESVILLAQRYLDGNQKALDFDKDDSDAMLFVATASNLRSHIYQIQPLKSLFEAKQMAGNIIPAVASSNAIVAAIQTKMALRLTEAIPVGNSNLVDYKSVAYSLRKVYLSYEGRNWLLPEKFDAPSAECSVCNLDKVKYSIISLDPTKFTLQDLIDEVKKNLNDSEIVISRSDGSLLYDSDFDDNAERGLIEFFQSKQLTLTIADEDSEYVQLTLVLLNSPESQANFEQALQFKKIVKPEAKRKREASDQEDEADALQNKKSKVQVVIDDEDDIIIAS